VAEGFPEAWIEDPALTPETDAVLVPHRDRITWDEPIHGVADIEALPFPVKALNIKPSRIGSLDALFDTYAYCNDHGIRMYGGGQFELGPGRGQIQYLASLFHPDSPNDVAPGGFNEPEPRPGLPTSPLAPAGAATGFRWAG
jgi:O-succinylbenzoate synthase